MQAVVPDVWLSGTQTPTNKRDVTKERWKCQKNPQPRLHIPPACCNLLFFSFFFSCVCLTLHRIFTLTTGSAHPSWQPAASPGKREYRPGASFQRGGFSSPKYLGVVEREDFCQATSFLLRQVTAACDGLSYSQEVAATLSEISGSHLNTADTLLARN